MQFNVPPDLEILGQKRLATGRFENAEEVFRRALDEKIDLALAQVAAGNVYGPDEARRKLAAMRETHLAGTSRQI